LDNENRLVQKLKGLEPEIAALIAPPGPLPAAHPASRDVYFVHRFAQDGTNSATLYKVATAASESCAAGYAEPQTAGPDLYFERLRHTARSLAECSGGVLPRAAQAPTSPSERAI